MYKLPYSTFITGEIMMYFLRHVAKRLDMIIHLFHLIKKNKKVIIPNPNLYLG